jgi:hypothetical protein
VCLLFVPAYLFYQGLAILGRGCKWMRSEAGYPAIHLRTVCKYAGHCPRCGMIRCDEAQRTVQDSRGGQ